MTMLGKTNNSTMMIRELEPVIIPRNDDITGRSESDIDKEMKHNYHRLGQERTSLEHRLLELQNGLNQIKKDNSILKVKSTITLGNMQLELGSIREDRQFLIEKRFYLEKKLRASEDSFELKEAELEALQSLIDEA